MNYFELQFKDIENLIDKHRKTLEERRSQKELYSEHHRLLDTKYIVHHQEFVEYKGTPEYKRMTKKDQDFCDDRWKEKPDRCKKELDNYETNRSIDEELHKALDGLYCSEKLSARYACILMYILASDWTDPKNLKNAKQAYNYRKKYK